VTDGEGVFCSKRSGLLADDDEFFNWQDQVVQHKERVLKCYQLTKEAYPEAKVVIIFGELFGGAQLFRERKLEVLSFSPSYCPFSSVALIKYKMHCNRSLPTQGCCSGSPSAACAEGSLLLPASSVLRF